MNQPPDLIFPALCKARDFNASPVDVHGERVSPEAERAYADVSGT